MAPAVKALGAAAFIDVLVPKVSDSSLIKVEFTEWVEGSFGDLVGAYLGCPSGDTYSTKPLFDFGMPATPSSNYFGKRNTSVGGVCCPGRRSPATRRVTPHTSVPWT